MNKIKKILNNENAGPNLEELIGLSIATIIVAGTWLVGRALYTFFYKTPTVKTINKTTNTNIVIGYNQ